jgi:predicted transcriptional regulator of viral defense system
MSAEVTATVEQRLARLADGAHGVVTRGRMAAAGISRAQIGQRVRSGALIRVHRGVYRVGHQAPSTEARYMAAVLACGEGALLSGRAAGHLLGLIKGRPPEPEVTAPVKRRVAGLNVRRAGDLAVDAIRWRGIPVTSVPRTLVDLAAELTVEELARACHEAGVRHRTTPRMVEAVLRRRPFSAGAAALRAVMSGDTPAVLSRLERGAVALVRDHGLPPPPLVNRPAGGRRVDLRWPQQRLTVELDGYRFHNSRHSWEQDRRREREARARGDEFRRYTWSDVFEHPASTVADLRKLLL